MHTYTLSSDAWCYFHKSRIFRFFFSSCNWENYYFVWQSILSTWLWIQFVYPLIVDQKVRKAQFSTVEETKRANTGQCVEIQCAEMEKQFILTIIVSEVTLEPLLMLMFVQLPDTNSFYAPIEKYISYKSYQFLVIFLSGRSQYFWNGKISGLLILSWHHFSEYVATVIPNRKKRQLILIYHHGHWIYCS